MKHDDERFDVWGHLASCTGEALDALGLHELASLSFRADVDAPIRVLVATDKGIVDLKYELERQHDRAYAFSGSLVGWADLSLGLQVTGGVTARRIDALDWTTTLKGLSGGEWNLPDTPPRTDRRVATDDFRAVLLDRLMPVEPPAADKQPMHEEAPGAGDRTGGR